MKGKKDPNGNKLKELDTKEELILSNLENKFNAKLEQYKIKYADYLKKITSQQYTSSRALYKK